jgi:hypothetical protein
VFAINSGKHNRNFIRIFYQHIHTGWKPTTENNNEYDFIEERVATKQTSNIIMQCKWEKRKKNRLKEEQEEKKIIYKLKRLEYIVQN